MDIEKFALLEASVAHLLESFLHLKEENRHLAMNISQLEQTVLLQQKGLEHMEHIKEELQQLRMTMQVWQHEREFFRGKLAQMLLTIEQLEGPPNLDRTPGRKS